MPKKSEAFGGIKNQSKRVEMYQNVTVKPKDIKLTPTLERMLCLVGQGVVRVSRETGYGFAQTEPREYFTDVQFRRLYISGYIALEPLDQYHFKAMEVER